ncbi:MAG: hypothetical protein KTR30_32440 [Saprospiraceae bacterium]|nr:hypothetical protein [Saprospiraceae bacterium]
MEKSNNESPKEKDTPKKDTPEQNTPEQNTPEKDTPEKEKSGVLEGIEDKVRDFVKDADKEISETIDAGVKRTKSFFRRLLIGLLVLAVLAGAGYMLYANYTYSEGMRAGNLIKISKKGMLFKTYEGQLKLGGIDLSNPTEGLSDTWSFSVTDEAIVKQLEKLQGQKVVLRYREINQSMPWQGDTNYFIVSIDQQKE